MQLVQYHDLNQIDYQDAWDYQTIVHQKLLHNKLIISGKERIKDIHHLILCEHNHVYTLGKSGDESHILLSTEERAALKIAYYKINRGGDITYHGPGQITGYPIFDMEFFYRDVHKYVRDLEEVVIQTLGEYGLLGLRIPDFTGVWLENEKASFEKICAIGVHMSRWVSLHGFAFNVNTDLSYFDKIVPCGINDNDKSVTSLGKFLGKEININEAKEVLLDKFQKVFNINYVDKI